MNDRLIAMLVHSEDITEDVESLNNISDNSRNLLDDLPPDFAAVATHPSDLMTLNEAL